MTGLFIYPLLSYGLGSSHPSSSPELKIPTVSAAREEAGGSRLTYISTPLAQPFLHNSSHRLSSLLPVSSTTPHKPHPQPANQTNQPNQPVSPPCPQATTRQSKTTSTRHLAAPCPVYRTSGDHTSPPAAAAKTGHVSAPPAGPAPTPRRASSRSAPAWTRTAPSTRATASPRSARAIHPVSTPPRTIGSALWLMRICGNSCEFVECYYLELELELVGRGVDCALQYYDWRTYDVHDVFG